MAGDHSESDLSDFCSQDQIKNIIQLLDNEFAFLDWGDLILQHMS